MIEFRSTVVNAILATDMSTHFDYVRKIREKTDRIQNLAHSDIDVTDQDRRLLTAAIIKCADISNAARPFPVAEMWCKVLLREFSMQSELEKKMGVPVSMPTEQTPIARAKSQIDFISALAMPLFAAVAQVIPEIHFSVDQLSVSKTTWENIRAAELVRLNDEKRSSVYSIKSVEQLRKGLSTDELNGEIRSPRQSRRLSLPFLRVDKAMKRHSNSQLSIKSDITAPHRPLSTELSLRTSLSSSPSIPGATPTTVSSPVSTTNTQSRRMSNRLSVCSNQRFTDAVAEYLLTS